MNDVVGQNAQEVKNLRRLEIISDKDIVALYEPAKDPKLVYFWGRCKSFISKVEVVEVTTGKHMITSLDNVRPYDPKEFRVLSLERKAIDLSAKLKAVRVDAKELLEDPKLNAGERKILRRTVDKHCCLAKTKSVTENIANKSC